MSTTANIDYDYDYEHEHEGHGWPIEIFVDSLATC